MRFQRNLSLGIFSLAVFAVSVPADAVVVDRILSDGVTTPSDATPVNTTAPADDPGWYRVPENRSAIYLGNQWMLTAAHAGAGSTVILDGGTFEAVPGSDIILSNPNIFDSTSLTDEADLRLFRIKTELTSGLTPEEHSANIDSSLVTLASDDPGVGTEVLMIGRGRARKVNTSDPAGHFHYSGNTLHGFDVDTNDANRIKTWGTNLIAADSLFQTNRSDSNNLFPVKISNGGRDVVAQLTQFDSDLYVIPNSDTPTEHEAQAASGDSGGPVFFKEDVNGSEQWVLGGLLHAIQLESGQPGRAVAFGNLTILSDLSLPFYSNQIDALLANDFAQFESVSGLSTDLVGYSIAGDINLDGVVSGDGTGTSDNDDLAAFVAGWLHEQATADVQSWVRGDLNQDGVTDLADFIELRAAYNGELEIGQLSALLGGVAVPEPTTAWLAGGFLLIGLRRRR